MASMAGIWGPAAVRLLRVAATRATEAVRANLASAARPLYNAKQQYIPIRSGRQPIHPAAFLKQQRRWISRISGQHAQAVRRFLSTAPPHGGARQPFRRSQLPSSETYRRVGQFSGRAPFANALRPNLTGGAMPRSAGGYGIGGGGARYFSHTPAAPAQVVQNVSQAMRAFFLSGQRLQYDGLGANGEPQYRAVSALEDQAMRKMANFPRFASGSFIDFKLTPTITALSPLAAALIEASDISGFKGAAPADGASLNTEGFLDVLSTDFGRALKDLTAIYADLRRLSVLGDLPVSMEKSNVLRVRFPGVDVYTLERLCDDIGIERGVLGQDPQSENMHMTLQIPFAPESEKAFTSPGGSTRSVWGPGSEYDALSEDSLIQEAFELDGNPWLSDPEEYESLSPASCSVKHRSQEFEGLEGIYRFLEECDRAKGRVG
ncbi:hypothetical protein ISF_03711 [Cordyceps fumosorosea ARSEF 2679]|uniref:Casein kinase II beta 2 subunit n=1 Tax=Cordyceps fumosorosea (strain ARSEF 2679) TaxID=1081104 RepID=A0A167ZHT4_CORFA|nr:hypothetical protein ISF_03711 [Cordyceps fumosorosea ARSEF 2679]OAA67535.1 hypothetical protein ISF_03711 [Cordyceps fumosorosea ARSEF 2679]